jgi:GGDEF domain-containing protein
MGTATGTSGSLLTEVFKIADQAMYTVKSRKKAQSANPDFVPQDQTTSRK